MRAVWSRFTTWWFCGKRNRHRWSAPANLLGIEVVKCERCGTTGFGPIEEGEEP